MRRNSQTNPGSNCINKATSTGANLVFLSDIHLSSLLLGHDFDFSRGEIRMMVLYRRRRQLRRGLGTRKVGVHGSRRIRRGHHLTLLLASVFRFQRLLIW